MPMSENPLSHCDTAIGAPAHAAMMAPASRIAKMPMRLLLITSPSTCRHVAPAMAGLYHEALTATYGKNCEQGVSLLYPRLYGHDERPQVR